MSAAALEPELALNVPAATERTLLIYDPRRTNAPASHDRQSRTSVARRLAAVMGWTFGGICAARPRAAARPYFVPHDALLAEDAKALGIRRPTDLFGSVVPHAFVATKAITHRLFGSDASAPAGWSHRLAESMGDSVLGGYTTFAPQDARRAALLLLREGPVRIKCVSGIGGSGQQLVSSEHELDAAIAGIAASEYGHGVTVEENLIEDVTFSVGTIACGDFAISYCGTQTTTRNHRGHDVYGGSTLDIVRGGWDELIASDLPPAPRAAVELARAYDAAAFEAYPGAFASRRNYDVLFGRDGSGRRRAGVLEQSWRIGGASGAEVEAIAAFRRDPHRDRVRCATVEIYDANAPIPERASIHYRGVDPHVGALTKYAIELDGNDT